MRNRRPMPKVEMTLQDIDRARRDQQILMTKLIDRSDREADKARAILQIAQGHTGLFRWLLRQIAKPHQNRAADLQRRAIEIKKASRMGDDIGLHRRGRRAAFRKAQD